MNKLFQKRSYDVSGHFLIPDLKRVQAGLRFSLAKVIDFYRRNPASLNASHILVRLLQNLNVPLSMDSDIYNDKVRDIALNLGMSLRMTSALSHGHVFSPGPFFGDHISEVLIANIDPFDLTLLDTNWDKLRPIRVLYHPKTDLSMEVLNGKTSSDEAGIAVLTINIPMLASQYRKWRSSRTGIEESPRTIQQFLMEIPIPNALYSQLDIAVMNRVIWQRFHLAVPSFKNRHSFQLTDWSDALDAAVGRFLELTEFRRWDFDTIISNFPVIAAGDLHEVIRTPDMAFSQQMQWAITLARLPLLVYLLKVNAESGNPRNQPYLNYIRRYFRQIDMSKVLKNALPEKMLDDVTVLIEEGVLANL